MSEVFEIVRAGYNRIGPRYRDWSAVGEVRLQWVDRLLSELSPGSVVVDLGCGPGEPATRLVQADLTRFAIRPASVDAVASFYALGHVPSQLHAPLLSSVASWLRPGGLLLTSAPVDAGDVTEDYWLGVPMFFGGIGEDATRQALTDAGLHLDTLEVVEEDEGDGHLVRFMWIVARKPAAGEQCAFRD